MKKISTEANIVKGTRSNLTALGLGCVYEERAIHEIHGVFNSHYI